MELNAPGVARHTFISPVPRVCPVQYEPVVWIQLCSAVGEDELCGAGDGGPIVDLRPQHGGRRRTASADTCDRHDRSLERTEVPLFAASLGRQAHALTHWRSQLWHKFVGCGVLDSQALQKPHDVPK